MELSVCQFRNRIWCNKPIWRFPWRPRKHTDIKILKYQILRTNLWRRARDSNPQYVVIFTLFKRHHIEPLSHQRYETTIKPFSYWYCRINCHFVVKYLYVYCTWPIFKSLIYIAILNAIFHSTCWNWRKYSKYSQITLNHRNITQIRTLSSPLVIPDW